jgi:hypothetical protein
MGTYLITPNLLIPMTADKTEGAFSYLKGIVTTLKTGASPYVTKGSSSGGSITAFSATPDGVDRWTGKTAAEAVSSSGPVWHVLEDSFGVQVLLAIQGDASLPLVFFGVAKNKFETSGAWRNAGSVSEIVYPRDTTSVVDKDQDVIGGTGGGIIYPYSNSGADQRFHVMRRTDAPGFYAVAVRAGVEGDYYLGGFCKLTAPKTTDTNPYVVFGGREGGGCSWVTYDLALGSGHSDVWARVPTDGTIRYCFGQWRAGSENVWERAEFGPDPFSGAYQGGLIPIYSRATGAAHIRGFLPDLERAIPAHISGTFANAAQTQVIFGDLIFPWAASAGTPLGV